MFSEIGFPAYCMHQHNVECNQLYGELPYSYHLNSVTNQYNKFKHLLKPIEFTLAFNGCYGHDLIEDARVTYNDIVSMIGKEGAEVIFLCTEMRGRNREERKNEEFYQTLKLNRVAVFVKLCDIIANMLHGATEGSGMFEKSKKEYPKIKTHLYRDEFKEMFDYIEKIILL